MPYPGFADDLHAAVIETFGEQVVYAPQGQPELTLWGVFRAAHQELDMTTGARVSVSEPELGFRIADLAPRRPQGGEVDEVVIRGERWFVSDVRPDGEGWVVVTLTTPRRV